MISEQKIALSQFRGWCSSFLEDNLIYTWSEFSIPEVLKSCVSLTGDSLHISAKPKVCPSWHVARWSVSHLASVKAQQTQSKIFLGQTYKNAELQIAANLALRTTDVKYLFRNCLWQKSHNEEKNQTVSVLTFGMIIAVMLYNLALTFPYQVDAINSKSSNIISDILTIIVPDQKIYILLNIKVVTACLSWGESHKWNLVSLKQILSP